MFVGTGLTTLVLFGVGWATVTAEDPLQVFTFDELRVGLEVLSHKIECRWSSATPQGLGGALFVRLSVRPNRPSRPRIEIVGRGSSPTCEKLLSPSAPLRPIGSRTYKRNRTSDCSSVRTNGFATSPMLGVSPIKVMPRFVAWGPGVRVLCLGRPRTLNP